MAVLSSINVDSDGIPNAGGTDSVPTLQPVLEALTDSGIKIHPDSQMPLDTILGPNLTYNSFDLDETKVEIKDEAGTVFSMAFWNYDDEERHVFLYNALSGDVTLGTTPHFAFMSLPPRKASGDPSVVIRGIDRGLIFDTGITIACVTDKSTVTGAPGSGDVACSIFYR
jgi:hypothetical protein